MNASVEGALEKHSGYHVVRKYEGCRGASPSGLTRDPDDIPSLLTTTEVD